jgi:hypothetical protein
MADEKDARGMLLRRFLDAETRGHSSEDYDVLGRAEAFFRKSEEEEQERIADFSEWIEDIAQQSHPESFYIEDDPIEPAPQIEPRQGEQREVLTELTAESDQLVSEADADTVEPKLDQKEEKVENAERSL